MDLGDRLDGIRTRLDLLRRVDAEHGFGVVIEEPGTLESNPDLPAGTVEVFRLFRRIEGDNFRFVQPEEIGSRAAWSRRAVDPNCPLGSPLVVAHETRGVPAGVHGGAPLYLDLAEGYVFYLDPDDYIALYKGVDEEVEVEDFGPDIATFFDEYVLGTRYPELVSAVLGPGVLTRRVTRGRFRGQYADNWLRLLAAAGLAG